MLFDPFFTRGLHLKNRIIMAPMCQYSAGEDGIPTPWYETHYVSRAVGQVRAFILEATAVEPRGRISTKTIKQKGITRRVLRSFWIRSSI